MQLRSDANSAAAIAITGVGLTTALGATAEDTWQAVVRGDAQPAPMPDIESPLPVGAAGHQAVDLPRDYQPQLPRETRYLRWTIESALRDAGLSSPSARQAIPPARRAVAIGTTLHGMRAGGRFYRSEDAGELGTFLAGDVLRLALDDLDFAGAATTSCSACSSGLGSVALAATLLQTGAADLVVAGGYDTVSEYVWAGFNSLRLVADGPLRPFSRDRRGMKLGEGYAILVLERLEDAKRRGANVCGVIAGWAESADAHHLTQSHPKGDGAARAMRVAMLRAGVAPSEVGLVAAHATGTPDNDAAEHAALSQVLGERLPQTPVVCFKTHLGHTLGAAGAAELIMSTMALRDGVIPPTANFDPAQLEFERLNVTHGAARKVPLQRTMNMSLGFGGANGCVVLAKPPAAVEVADTNTPASKLALREVWITGIGVVLPGAVGIDAFAAKLKDDAAAPAWVSSPPPLADSDFEHLLNARRVRRMSRYTTIMLAAAQQACGDARLLDDPALLAETGAMLGTTHGAVNFCHEYYQQIVRDGVLAANPVLFAEGVPNVGAAQLSLMLGLKQSCQSIIGTRTAGLDALRLAWLRIAAGQADRIIVGAGEEDSPLIERVYEHCGLRRTRDLGLAYASTAGFRTASGAVAFVIESADAARARGVEPYAKLGHAAAARGTPDALPRTLASVLRDAPREAQWVGSGCGTWIDKLEMNALTRDNGVRAVGSIYSRFGEAFSTTPLISAAAAIVLGHLPDATPTPAAARAVGRTDRFGVICTDWQGGVATAHLELGQRKPQTKPA